MPFPTPKELTENTSYGFAISDDTLTLVRGYLSSVQADITAAGLLLQEELKGVKLAELTPIKFIQHIINTKKPKNFAENILASSHDRKNSGYSDKDLEILARIGTVILSYAYNDGGHYRSFKKHDEALPCIMGYISAPLFTFKRGSLDDDTLTLSGERKIDADKYNREIEERLLPTLLQMSMLAGNIGKKLAVTIPGLGCGLFGGPFGDNGDHSIYYHLNNALKKVINKHADKLSNIDSIYFDTYNVVIEKESIDISGIHYQCVASLNNPDVHKQLELSEVDKNNPDIMLGTIVAADLISWAGNDMWEQARQTDEGVKGGSSLTLVQIACSLCPTAYKMDDFKYIEQTGACRHETKQWAQIALELKQDCQYASDKNEITVHQLERINLSAVDLVVETVDGENLSEHQEDNNNNDTFNFQFLVGLAAISSVSLVIGVLALTSVIAAPLGVGIGMIALGCAIGIGATCFGLFSKKGDEGSALVDGHEQNAFNL